VASYLPEVERLTLKQECEVALRLIVQRKCKKWFQSQGKWIDTSWTDVESARRHFPKFTYREVWVRCE
jgi:hypothetical protein